AFVVVLVVVFGLCVVDAREPGELRRHGRRLGWRGVQVEQVSRDLVEVSRDAAPHLPRGGEAAGAVADGVRKRAMTGFGVRPQPGEARIEDGADRADV